MHYTLLPISYMKLWPLTYHRWHSPSTLMIGDWCHAIHTEVSLRTIITNTNAPFSRHSVTSTKQHPPPQMDSSSSITSCQNGLSNQLPGTRTSVKSLEALNVTLSVLGIPAPISDATKPTGLLQWITKLSDHQSGRVLNSTAHKQTNMYNQIPMTTKCTSNAHS